MSMPERPRSDSVTQVVVVEDSPLQAEALVNLLQEDPHLRVIVTAMTGLQGVAAVLSKRPGLVTVDIDLPDIDGFEVVTRIMSECPTPIVVVTATLRARGRRNAFEALGLGALDVIEKPTFELLQSPEWRARIQRHLRLVAQSPVIPHVMGRVRHRFKRPPLPASAATPVAPRPQPAPLPAVAPEVLVIVASAGGPKTVQALLAAMRPSFPLPVPIVVALHFGEILGATYSDFLARMLDAPVVQLGEGCRLQPGIVYVAPPGRQTLLVPGGSVRVFEDLAGTTYKPCFDLLLSSTAAVYGHAGIGVILTGMGNDGAQGMYELRQRGGLTIGQDRASSVVYGMPRAAFEMGAVLLQQPPDAIARTLLAWLAHVGPKAQGAQ